MTKRMTGGSEVERHLRQMKKRSLSPVVCANGENDDRLHER